MAPINVQLGKVFHQRSEGGSSSNVRCCIDVSSNKEASRYTAQGPAAVRGILGYLRLDGHLPTAGPRVAFSPLPGIGHWAGSVKARD